MRTKVEVAERILVNNSVFFFNKYVWEIAQLGLEIPILTELHNIQ